MKIPKFEALYTSTRQFAKSMTTPLIENQKKIDTKGIEYQRKVYFYFVVELSIILGIELQTKSAYYIVDRHLANGDTLKSLCREFYDVQISQLNQQKEAKNG